MNVTAIIVTRGDQDLTPVIASIPDEWGPLVWDNSVQPDYGVFGRYMAIDDTDAELIYVQDDDCVVSDPRAIVEHWWEGRRTRSEDSFVVCNMPPEFRHDFYEEHALVGFGACFHRDAPARAFRRFREAWPLTDEEEFFNSTCDIVFTGLTPRVLVDVPVESLPYAHHETRMWKQAGHQARRVRMLDYVRQIRQTSPVM